MENTKHTPGPWRITAAPCKSSRWVEIYGDCTRTEEDVAQAVGAANARLIAAAPEMLEALKWAMRQLPRPSRIQRQGDRYCDGHEAARAAIARATGEEA